MKHQSNSNCSSNYGEVVARQVNVLASCYIVDPSASLKGLHYCTTGAAGTSFPSFFPLFPLFVFIYSYRNRQLTLCQHRGRVVFLRSLSQAYHPLRQVPPSRHSLPTTSWPCNPSPRSPPARHPTAAITTAAAEGGQHSRSGKNVRGSSARP